MGGDLVVGCGFMEGVVGGVVEALQNQKGEEGEGERYEVTEVWMQKEVSPPSPGGCFISLPGEGCGGIDYFPPFSCLSLSNPPLSPFPTLEIKMIRNVGQHRRSSLSTPPPRHPRTSWDRLKVGGF